MSLVAEDFHYIRSLVRTQSAVHLDESKEYLVQARLACLVHQEGLESVHELVQRLRAQRHGDLHRQVVEAMTTSETSFFRDLPVWEAIRLHVLPELIQARAAERRVALWSAACASGQEPYTLAMVIREHFPALLGWDLQLLASDLSRRMVARVMHGLYTQAEVNRGLPASLLLKYFCRDGIHWRVKNCLSSMVRPFVLNLVEPWPALPAMDLVLLRNVLLYFDLEAKRAVLSRVRRILRPDGYLFLGAAETTLNLDDGFEPVQVGNALAYRRLER